ncbi:Npepl1 [Symbiodinium sp. CCMP2456]|nr:Npepl1 [Symbiodinium sp. CCMP2456]
MWIVGSAPELLQVAKDIAEALKVPVLAAAAEAVAKQVENDGSTKAATFLIGEELRTVTLLAVPPAQSRVVCKARPDVIAKHMQGKIRGKDIVIAVTEENRLATGLAVARCLPPFASKADTPSPADATVRFYGVAPGPLLAKLNHMATAVRLAQGLVDMPPNFIQPATLKEFVLAATKGLDKVTAHVMEGTELRDKGYGGLWNVGKSADQIIADFGTAVDLTGRDFDTSTDIYSAGKSLCDVLQPPKDAPLLDALFGNPIDSDQMSWAPADLSLSSYASVMGVGDRRWFVDILYAMQSLVPYVSNIDRMQEECDVLALTLARYDKVTLYANLRGCQQAVFPSPYYKCLRTFLDLDDDTLGVFKLKVFETFFANCVQWQLFLRDTTNLHVSLTGDGDLLIFTKIDLIQDIR